MTENLNASGSRETLTYAQHPSAMATIARLKTQYDRRRRNADESYTLEDFYAKQDKQGTGEVRVEDYRAGWALGGVKLAPHDMYIVKGSYGVDDRKIRYPESLSDLSTMSHTSAVNHTMKERMGAPTAKYCGYAHPDELVEPPAKFDTQPATIFGMKWTGQELPSHTDPGLNTMSMRDAAKVSGSFPPPKSAAATMTASRLSASGHTDKLMESLQEFDPNGTGLVTLEAFLTSCARATVSVQPAELDALRTAGTLRRPFKASPELVEYGTLLQLMDR